MLQRVKPRLAAISLLIRNVVLKSVANSQRAPREICEGAILTPTGVGVASTIGKEKPARTHTHMPATPTTLHQSLDRMLVEVVIESDAPARR